MDLLNIIRVNLGQIKLLKILLYPFNRVIRRFNEYKMNYYYKKNGILVFNTFVETLNELNITFWPEFGTLLGIHRENDFLKHDYDFDFGAYIDNFDFLTKALKDKGFKLLYTYYCPDDEKIKESTYSFKGVNIDIFYFVRKSDGDYCYTFIPGNTENITELHYKIKVFKFEKIELINRRFKGHDILLPKDIENHLTVSFGASYMIPDPNFKSINFNFLDNYYALKK